MPPKLLFISPVTLFPQDRGQRVRIANMIRACANVFSVTTVLPQAVDDVEREQTKALCSEVIEVPGSRLQVGSVTRVLMSFRAIERLDPVRCNMIARFRAKLGELDLDAYDLIWVERRDLLQIVGSYIRKTVVDLDDIEHKKKWAELAFRSSLVEQLRGVPRVLGLLASEILVTSRAKAVLVCSENDEAYLRRCGVRQARAVPNGTSMLPINAAIARSEQDVAAVFLGNIEYSANADALRWFGNDIAPLLAAAGCRVSVTVVGNAPADIASFSTALIFKGFVKDLSAELQLYDVAIAPLRFGGGTKLKVLDVLASGLPLVTTSVGAEGLGLRNEIEALIADDAKSFATGVIRLANNAALRRRLSECAISRMRQFYTWDAVVERTADWLRSLVVH